jgi:hypothetical protein
LKASKLALLKSKTKKKKTRRIKDKPEDKKVDRLGRVKTKKKSYGMQAPEPEPEDTAHVTCFDLMNTPHRFG